MKKTLLLLTLAPADLFCRPMKGWKQIKGDYFLPPLTPLPPFGKDDFRGGYNLGFLAGMAEAAKR